MDNTNLKKENAHLDVGKYILRLQSGATGPDEYFCMVLSIKGPSETFKCFPFLIDVLQETCPRLHKQLIDIYESYFVELQVEEDISYHGGCPLKQEEDDFQLALKLSLADVNDDQNTAPSASESNTDNKAGSYQETPAQSSLLLPEIDTLESYQNLMFDGYGATALGDSCPDFNISTQVPPMSLGSQFEQQPDECKAQAAQAFNPKQRRKRIQDGHLSSLPAARSSNRNTAYGNRGEPLYEAPSSNPNPSSSTPTWASLSACSDIKNGIGKGSYQYLEKSTNVGPRDQVKEVYFASNKTNDTLLSNGGSTAPAHSIITGRFSASNSENCHSIPGASNTNLTNGGCIPKDTKKSRKSKNKKSRDLISVERPLGRKPVLYWIRRDIRVYDNPALLHAFNSDSPIIPVFLWSEKEEGHLAAGGATKLWLHHALKDLNQSYHERYNSQILFVKTMSCLDAVKELVAKTGAESVIWNDVYEPYLKQRDDKIQHDLKKKGVEVCRFHSYLLHEPSSIDTEKISMWGIGSVSHFMYASSQNGQTGMGLPEDPPPVLPLPTNWPAADTLDQLDLAKMPRRKNGTIINWAEPIIKNWDFSENGAYAALELFLQDGVRRYEKESSRGDQNNTARISPYLHFGQLSPRTVVAEAQTRKIKSRKFQRKLAWRDLSYWLLHMFPQLNSEPIRPHYKYQRWSSNKAHLKAWQRGYTGFPLVDAAMRELWLSGWLNNYMRHVVASFLISYLHLHWIEGYKWFQDTLLDADVAINAMMWQNGGMSGLDQWNFVMHPIDAAMTCDPKGDYIRKWLPALQSMPDEYIHRPWKCPPSILKRAKVELGVSYPHRIITDLEAAREQSLQDVTQLRTNQGRQYICPYTGNDLIFLPDSNVMVPVITRKEFKYKTKNPESEDNPHSAVLKGYRTRKRDELIAFENKVDFTASTMLESTQRMERYKQESQVDML